MADVRDTMLAYRRLFLGDDGGVTTDGELVLRDLEKRCGWLVSSLPTDNGGRVDPLATAAAVERRGVYAHIKASLYGRLPERKERE